MTMRTKLDVDTLSIDDLYNNLRVFEQELTSTSKSSANAQNVAFVSHSKSSNNKVKSGHNGSYSTYTPSTSSNNIPEREVPAGFADEGEHTVEEEETNHALKEISLNIEDHPLKNMEDGGIFDSGYSGHMTGNKDHLDDFEEYKGGSVTFGGSKGYITGKGRIRVGNLDFDSVSFVKELGHFNLFSISQICDKKHKVPDFKMPDENQILLKVPRQNNMYSFDMK
ncbi:hypothetical protein Tco_0063530, partial [Tanacetum coccineum]